MVLDELELNADPGSSRRREEALWPAGPPQGRGAGSLSSHAAAVMVTVPVRAAMVPAAIRASQVCRVVTTAYSQRSRLAAHATRAWPPLSRLPSWRPVRCAYRARSTRLWRMPTQTARQAATRSPGRPRREIRVLPAKVAEVFSRGSARRA